MTGERKRRDSLHLMNDSNAIPPVRPEEGWHVLHLFYRVEHGEWAQLTGEEKIAAKTHFSELVQEIRATAETQLLVFSMVTPKADLGLMLLTPDLQTANAFEKRLTLSLGPDILTPVYSFLSLTEESEYMSTPADVKNNLATEDGLTAGTPEFEAKLKEVEARLAKYRKDKLYPVLPVWEVFCFYPMTKRRAPEQNWYGLSFEDRKRLMAGHARVGRQYHGKILQLITGCTGLDDAEWGVSLFAHDPFYIKEIVYKMRFDEVSAQYSDFGEFYIGLSIPLSELFQRMQL